MQGSELTTYKQEPSKYYATQLESIKCLLCFSNLSLLAVYSYYKATERETTEIFKTQES
jgi:hypothetical protein